MPNQLSTAPSFDAETLEGYSLALVRDHTPKVHTHVEAQIVDLDHDAQKVKGVIIDDEGIGDQKVLAYNLATERIVYIEQAPAGAAIDSIQRGSITLPPGSPTGDAAINAVDITQSWVAMEGQYILCDVGLLDRASRFDLIDETTVRLSMINPAHAHTVHFTVFAFSSGIKSIQNNFVTMPAANTEVTDEIDEVGPSKSMIFNRGFYANHASGYLVGYNFSLIITDSTTITVIRVVSAPVDFKYYYTVVEFL